MSSSTLPPSLKKINVFLKRAEELDRDKSNPESRVVAYNCRQYAVQIGIPLVSSSSSSNENDAAKKSLGELLTTLESEKKAMSVFSKREHWKISRKVADRVFDKADAEDRAGVANKGTARSFYAAATFYEILQQFHDEEIKTKSSSNNGEEDLNEDEASIVEHMEEEDQRRVYCKWKATDILTAIKEGRVPQPGGYKKEEEEEVVDDAENNNESVVNNDVVPAYEDKNDLSLPPPAPIMSSSDLFEMPTQNEKHSETNNMPPPPSYDGIELSLSGQPSTTTITNDAAQETTNNDDLFIPAPPVTIPPPVSAPPAYSQQNIMSSNNHHDGSNSNNNGGKGMFSSIFQTNKASSKNKKLTKAQMGDAIELTKFALAALQKGNGELGRERLEQALGVWK